MEHLALERLETLQKLNSQRSWVNKDLYRLLYKEELYVVAYERIKSKPGNMTPGTDGMTLDSFSLVDAKKIIDQLRDESFQFTPVRRTEIGNPTGDRKLGIPPVKDKLVQELMRMILQAIYDSPEGPYFLDTSHGFRPSRSCHSALRDFRRKWRSVNWIIEGDIKACFDEIDHHVLVHLLQRKISDERFIRLIWKFLRAGYMEEMGQPRQDSLVGTPQGGIVSPILANIYLHELDVKVEEIKDRENKGERKGRNPEYSQLYNEKRRILRRAHKDPEALHEVEKRLRETPERMPGDPSFIRVHYIRYADDWIIGVAGPKTLAEDIQEEIKAFLRDELRLMLSEEKTGITHARTEYAKFLGTLLKIGWGDGKRTKAKMHQYRRNDGKAVKRRSAGWLPYMKAPVEELVSRLAKKGFCEPKTGMPIHKKAYIELDPVQIVQLYGSINRGILNYYRFTDNFVELRRIQYILQYSCAKTLAAKWRTSLRKVFKRLGLDLKLRHGLPGGRIKTVSFDPNTEWKRKPTAFRVNDWAVDLVPWYRKLRTRSKLDWPCVICGSYDNVEMHHVRHIKKMGTPKPKGFAQIMAALNRKQLPVCHKHHVEIHNGKYDAMSLADLAYNPLTHYSGLKDL